MAKWNAENAGLAMLAVAEVPQVMSAFLPSPATARMGFNEGEDYMERVAYLRRGEIVGSSVALTLALAITLIMRPSVGEQAWGPFIGAVIVLGVFLYEYERAIQAALRDAGGHADPGELAGKDFGENPPVSADSPQPPPFQPSATPPMGRPVEPAVPVWTMAA